MDSGISKGCQVPMPSVGGATLRIAHHSHALPRMGVGTPLGAPDRDVRRDSHRGEMPSRV